MATSFLEKFKGKTQQVGKQGLMGLMTDNTDSLSNNKIVVQTNIQVKAQQPSYQKQKSVQSRTYNTIQQDKYAPHKQRVPQYTKVNQTTKHQININKQPQQPSPFHVLNPFCLDDQQPGQPFNPPVTKKPNLAIPQKQYSQVSYKNTSKNINMTVRGSSTDNKGWSKLGGLGANIGGQNWQEKKKKLEKMQEFAEQVKMANQEKVKERKPFQEREMQIKKQKTIRDKALQYSKNIPKPAPKRTIVKKQSEEQMPSQQNRYSQLQEYQRRHKQLQRLINN